MISSILPRLQGKNAIETLQYYVKELEQDNQDLTKKQIQSLKNVAKELIAPIETELSVIVQNVGELPIEKFF